MTETDFTVEPAEVTATGAACEPTGECEAGQGRGSRVPAKEDILRPLHSGYTEVDIGDGMVIYIRPITQSVAKKISQDTENRTSVGANKPYAVQVGDREEKIILYEETIALATLMEHLVAEPKLTFSEWVALSEANYPLFARIAAEINRYSLSDFEKLKNALEPQAPVA